MESLANSFCSLFWTKILLIWQAHQSAVAILRWQSKSINAFLNPSVRDLCSRFSICHCLFVCFVLFLDETLTKVKVVHFSLVVWLKVILSFFVTFGFLFLSFIEFFSSVLKHHAYIEAFITIVGKYSKFWLAKRLHPANGKRN